MQRGGGGNINLNVSGDEAAAMGINAGAEIMVLIQPGVAD